MTHTNNTYNEREHKIVATFNLTRHPAEFRHWVGLFDSKYGIRYTTFNGETIVDAFEL